MTNKTKHTPLRMCVACRKMCDKAELIRIVFNKNAGEDGEVHIDPSGKAHGRGAYIHAHSVSPDCIGIAVKKNALSRALRCNASKITEEIYEQLR